ncbi:MAG: M48 family metallopeptidase [Pseudomonadota bacterium]
MSDTFSLVVKDAPECVVSRGQAAKHIAKKFNMPVEKALALMNGENQVVSRGLDLERAKQYAEVFDQAGVPAQVVEDQQDTERRTPLTAADIAGLFKHDTKPNTESLDSQRDWLTAITIALLPIGYGFTVAGVIGLALWYGISAPALDDPSGLGVSVFYVLPLLLLLVTVVVICRPFFSSTQKQERPYSLSPEKEPLLYALVHEICERGDLQVPAEVRLNCRVGLSVGPKTGWSGFAQKESVLTIGLPLIAGLTIRQFAGALAHELGHYRGIKDPRVLFFIYRVNRWLYQCGYEKDELDLRCEKQLQLPNPNKLWYAQVWVSWASKQFFKGLSWLAKQVSFSRMRQIEFVADQFQAAVAGIDEFKKTTLKMHLMHLAYDDVMQDLVKTCGERGLPEDLPALVITRANGKRKSAQHLMQECLNKKTTQVQGLHPADLERINKVESSDIQKIMIGNGSVTAIFDNFAASCRTASCRLYDDLLDKRVTQSQLISNAQFDTETAQTHPQYSQLNGYFLNMFCPSAYVAVGDYGNHLKRPRKERIQELHQLCTEIRRASPEARKAVAEYVSTRQAFFELAANNKWLELNKKDTDGEEFEALTKQVYSARAWLRDFERPYTERLELALAAALSDAAAQGSGVLKNLKDQIDPLVEAQNALVENQNLILEVYRYAGQGTIAEAHAREHTRFRGEPLKEELERLRTLYADLRHKLKNIPYPLASPAAGNASILAHLEWNRPEDQSEVSTSCTWQVYGTLSGLEQAHVDIMTALTKIAAAAEAEHGVRLKLVS